MRSIVNDNIIKGYKLKDAENLVDRQINKKRTCLYQDIVALDDKQPFEISEDTLKTMDESMDNFDEGKVSKPIKLK